MGKITRRTALFGAGAALGAWGGFKLPNSAPDMTGAGTLSQKPSPSFLNDASGLSHTPVSKHIIVEANTKERLVSRLRQEMTEARFEGRPMNVGAARHSMGGHAIPRDGTAITISSDDIAVDTAQSRMRVSSGVTWAQVISRVDPLGLSPMVMQSNNDFGVGATFCVNAHGWPVKKGPMGSTVRSCEIMMPSGDLITCSRKKNPDLFQMAMGGYGLIGIITELEVDLAKNQMLEPTFEKVSSKDFGHRFVEALNEEGVTMAYGRANVDRGNFMQDALVITYRPSADQSDIPAASGSGMMSHLSSHIYRAQLGNERMKKLRWKMEADLNPMLAGASTRNSLINEPVATLDDRDPLRTDILHEYFVAPDRFADFVDVCRQVIPASYQEFLNVTLRFVDTDPESLLSYAPVPRIAAVMSFSQEMTSRGEADMTRMTQELIDGVLSIGGSYYLPYRPHATLEQLVKAYPRAEEFASKKRQLDPKLIYQNGFWNNYLDRL